MATGDLDSDWPGSVADYIRNNDEAVLRGTDRLLSSYQNDFLTSSSFDEFCDVTGKCTLSLSLSLKLNFVLKKHIPALSDRFTGRYTIP